MKNEWSGIRVFSELPPGEKVGLIFEWEGQVLFITQSDLEDLKKRPTVDEMKIQLAAIRKLIKEGKPNE